MRLKIALLCALLVPLGTAKADVVTLSNLAGSGSTTGASLFIIFTTTTDTGGAFQLGNLTLFGSLTDEISYALKNSAGNIINSISGSGTMAGGVLSLNTGLFGAGTYWLEVTELAAHDKGASTTLTRTPTNLGVSEGLLTAGLNDIVATDIFRASLTVNVPEPATMILTGSALAAGAIGAYFKRRRKPQTEIAA